MWCWSLIKRIIGPAAEENLDLFIDVLRERWNEKPFEIPEYVMWPREPYQLSPHAEVGWPKPERLKELDYLHTTTFENVRKVSD